MSPFLAFSAVTEVVSTAPKTHGYLEDPACSRGVLRFDANVSGGIVADRGRGQKLVSRLAGEFHLSRFVTNITTS